MKYLYYIDGVGFLYLLSYLAYKLSMFDWWTPPTIFICVWFAVLCIGEGLWFDQNKEWSSNKRPTQQPK